MKPEFATSNSDWYEGMLLCPVCSEDYLHQGKVEVFNRKEDEKTGLHVTVCRASVAADGDLNGNPSDRRQGLRIEFGCEMCQEIFPLAITQHKGNTYFSWEIVSRRPWPLQTETAQSDDLPR